MRSGNQTGAHTQANRLEEIFRRQVDAHPDNIVSYLGLAGLLNASERCAEAITVCEAAVKVDPNMALVRSELGFALMGCQRFEDAEGELRRAVKIEPDSVLHRRRLALVLAHQHRNGQAIEILQNSLILDPGHGPTIELLKTLRAKNDQLSLVEQRLREEIEAHPNNVNSRLELASLLIHEARFPQAVKICETAAQLEPTNPMTQAMLGFALLTCEQFDAAEEPLRKALDLQPNESSHIKRLTMALVGQHRFGEAVRFAECVVKLDPEDSEMAETLQDLTDHINDLKTTQRFLKKALRLNPTDPHTLFNLGRVLIELGEYDEAERPLLESARILDSWELTELPE